MMLDKTFDREYNPINLLERWVFNPLTLVEFFHPNVTYYPQEGFPWKRFTHPFLSLSAALRFWN